MVAGIRNACHHRVFPHLSFFKSSILLPLDYGYNHQLTEESLFVYLSEQIKSLKLTLENNGEESENIRNEHKKCM
jgi:hypothetical protein